MIPEFLEILERHSLSNEEAAVLCGMAPHTVRCVRLSGKAPTRAHCRAAIAAFVERNRVATTREGLRMPADRRPHATHSGAPRAA